MANLPTLDEFTKQDVFQIARPPVEPVAPLPPLDSSMWGGPALMTPEQRRESALKAKVMMGGGSVEDRERRYGRMKAMEAAAAQPKGAEGTALETARQKFEQERTLKGIETYGRMAGPYYAGTSRAGIEATWKPKAAEYKFVSDMAKTFLGGKNAERHDATLVEIQRLRNEADTGKLSPADQIRLKTAELKTKQAEIAGRFLADPDTPEALKKRYAGDVDRLMNEAAVELKRPETPVAQPTGQIVAQGGPGTVPSKPRKYDPAVWETEESLTQFGQVLDAIREDISDNVMNNLGNLKRLSEFLRLEGAETSPLYKVAQNLFNRISALPKEKAPG